MDNLILIGMPGSGKSTVGVLLAKQLGYGFLDTDLLIQQQHGALLQTIIETRGVDGFLDAECDVLSALACRRTVIAPGGSCVCRDGGMARLKSLGRVLYLDVPFDVLRPRLYNLKTRGIAMAPGEDLQSVYRYRVPRYEAWADARIPVAAGQTIEQTVSLALAAARALEAE